MPRTSRKFSPYFNHNFIKLKSVKTIPQFGSESSSTMEQLKDQVTELTKQVAESQQQQKETAKALENVTEMMLAMQQENKELKEQGKAQSQSRAVSGVKVKKESTPNSDNKDFDVCKLIEAEQDKATVSVTISSLIKLKQEKGQIQNGKVFKSKFLGYLEAIGLKAAVEALRTASFNEDMEEEETLHKGRVEQLLKDTSEKRWRKAHIVLKSVIHETLYETLITLPEEGALQTENFFSLWDRINRLIGNTGTMEESYHLMTKWAQLALEDGTRMSELLSKIETTANMVNVTSGNTVYTDFHKNFKLMKIMEKYKTFREPCNKLKEELKTQSWQATKKHFMKWAPRTDSNEELPCSLNEETLEVGLTNQADGYADAARKAPRTAPPASQQAQGNSDRCYNCNEPGHRAADCRRSRYTGYADRNSDCKSWVISGRCTWPNSRKNEKKTPCRFLHNPSKRGIGHWESGREPPREEKKGSVNNAEVANNPQIDALSKRFDQFLSMFESRMQNSQQNLQQTTKNDGTSQVFTGSATAEAGTGFVEVLGERHTLAPTAAQIGFSGSATRFEVLSEPDDVPELRSDSESDENSEEETDLNEMMVKIRARKQKLQRKQNAKNKRKTAKNEAKENNGPTETAVLEQQQSKVEAESTQLSTITAICIWLLCIVWKCIHAVLSLFNAKEESKEKFFGSANGNHKEETTTENKISVILDTGCSNSSGAKNIAKFLKNLAHTVFRLRTANKGVSTANTKGDLDINGVKVNVLAVDDFEKTLISWADLSDLGITGTMEKEQIKLYTADGKLWTILKRHQDRLYHFDELERRLA